MSLKYYLFPLLMMSSLHAMQDVKSKLPHIISEDEFRWNTEVYKLGTSLIAGPIIAVIYSSLMITAGTSTKIKNEKVRKAVLKTCAALGITLTSALLLWVGANLYEDYVDYLNK